MTNADTEQGRFMFEEWHRRTAAADLQGLLDLYAEDVTFESPLVPRRKNRTRSDLVAKRGGLLLSSARVQRAHGGTGCSVTIVWLAKAPSASLRKPM